MSNWENYLNSIYFDPKHPASFGGPDKLYRTVKVEGRYRIGKERIRKWLQDRETYSLTRGARRHFTRSRVIVEGLDSQWDSDLMDMTSLSKDNDGINFVLVAIDIFSRKLWCRPIKNKTGTEVAKALKNIFEEGRQPKYILRTDKGKEFVNNEVEKLLRERGIQHIVSHNETKANYAERVIKTIKQKLLRYVMKKQSYRYVDVLQDTVKSYNDTIHRSLRDTPNAINEKNESESRLHQYLIRKPKLSLNSKFKYNVGETVRISHLRGIFDREYSQKWTGEIFKVENRYRREGIPVYKLEDWNGENVEGTFYETELQSVRVDENTPYKIEKILRRKGKGARKQVLVRWLHWPQKYDSWIPESEVKNYQSL
ncbi:hypothetical protein BOW31_12870 [Solemya velum gill symbiont]|nr:hypothetical protein BOW24_11585 [Solemya velum gill symbiont]OOZ21250.1 hypothetical protein BOW31_12870 [Solemya velum gill symbiont]